MPEQTSEADSQRHELEVRGRSSGCPANEAGDTERDKAAKAYELTGRLAERSRQEVGHSISWVLCVGCGLTPAHDLRGAARYREPTLHRLAVPARHHPTAAPRRVHALVSLRGLPMGLQYGQTTTSPMRPPRQRECQGGGLSRPPLRHQARWRKGVEGQN